MTVPVVAPYQAPHVPRLVFGPHDRITIAGVAYTPVVSDGRGHLLRRVATPAITEEFGHEAIWLLSDRRDWRLEPDWFAPECARRRLGTEAYDLSDLSSREAPDVVWKWTFAVRFARMYEAGECTKTNEDMERAIALIHADLKHADYAVVPARATRRRRKDARGHTATRPARRPGTKPRKAYAGNKVEVVLRQPPTPRTIHRWLVLLDERGHHPVSLRDGRYRSGDRRPRIVGDALRLLVHHGNRYATLERPTIRNLHRDLKAAVDEYNLGRAEGARIACPSRSALGRYIAGLGRFHVYAGRYGLEKAQRKFAVITSGVAVTRPYERIEADSWTVDLQTLLTEVGLWDRLHGKTQREVGRMHFCAAIDVASKVIVGAALTRTPSVAAALKVLRMTVSDKQAYARAAGAVLPWDQCATFEGLALDGGPQFNNAALMSAVAGLGCSPDFPSGGVPSLRGTMESFFRTVGTQLVARLPGRTFENVLERARYDAEGRASVDGEELARIIVRWIVDAYHGSPHDGLAGETPHDAWIRLTRMWGIRKAPDRHTVRSVFGIPLTRTLGNGGIQALNLRYWSEGLSRVFLNRGRVDVEVMLDPEYLGAVAVRIDGRWEEAACTAEGFEETTLEAWIRASRDLARTHAAGAAVTQGAVNAALRAANDLARQAMDRIGISGLPPTGEDVARAEREIMLGWTMPDAAPREHAAAEPDPFKGGIPATGADGPEPPAAADDDFSTED